MMYICRANERCVKTPPNYPPHPPMPASYHREPAGHIPADYLSPGHSGTVAN